MNVLSDILCNSSPLILSSSYNAPLLSHNSVSTKSKQNIVLPNQKELLDPFSAMQNNRTPNLDNNLFQPENTVNMVPGSYSMHSDEPNGFHSDPLHDSWFTNDLMKVSETMPNTIAPQHVSDYYTTPLEYGQNSNEGMNSNCMPNNQALLHVGSSRNKYAAPEALLMSSFTDINNAQISVDKRLCDKYTHDNIMPQDNTDPSIMNGMVPLNVHSNIHSTIPDSQLHLSLSNHLGNQTLPNLCDSSVITNVQNRNVGPIDNMNDKLPHISLNQLDSILDNNLGGLPMIQNNFQSVNIVDKQQPNFTQQSAIGPCSAVMTCNDTGLSNLSLLQFAQSQELFETSHSLPQRFDDYNDNIDCFIEETQCFKCKHCLFLSLDKKNVRNHILQQHTRTTNNNVMSNNPIHALYTQSSLLNEQFPAATTTSNSNQRNVNHIQGNVQLLPPAMIQQNGTNKNFICKECNLSLGSLKTLKRHLCNIHGLKPNYTPVDSFKTKQSPRKSPLKNVPGNSNVNSRPNAEDSRNFDADSTDTNLAKNSAELDGRMKDNAKKNTSKNSPGTTTTNNNDAKAPSNSKRQLSSHKKAWQRKMKRELGSYICEFKGCNVRFRAIDNLEYHRKCHVASSGKFACPECGTMSDNWGTAAGHLWRQHSTDMELHSCNQCPFKTYSLSNLENLHKPIHDDKCIFSCDICAKAFKNGKQLRNHKTIHTKQQTNALRKKYACFICSRQFLLKKFLRYHLDVVHNKQRQYFCKFCGYAASKSGTLSIHIRQHTGEKPYHCDKCNYQSADQSSLRRHKMTHSGEKRYKCAFCPYASIQSSTYKAHLKKEHPGLDNGLLFSCTICSFHTVKQDNYNAHMADHEMEKASSCLESNSLARFNVDSAQLPHESDILPLVEAVDISLSHEGRMFHNRDKDISSCLIDINGNCNLLNQPR